MKLDRRLNLVIEVEREHGPIHVHAAPIGREVFERYYKPIARAHTDIFAGGYTAFSGPRIAKLLLADAARAFGMLDGEDGVERGLMAEIRRLTNVIMPGPSGWTTLPFEDAKARQLLDEDELAEVENTLVFFILISAISLKSELKIKLAILSAIWKTHDTSLNCTEYASSLPTSTATENTGEKAHAAAVHPPAAHRKPHPASPVPNATIDGKPSSIPY
jgi:hypothetical protein